MKKKQIIEPKTIPILIGMTTIPERIELGKTAKSIQSLLQSIFVPEKIILSIPSKTLKGKTYPIHLLQSPPFQHPNVFIQFMDEDVGPLLKLTGLLKYMKDNNITHTHFMIADDDIIYHPHTTRILWRNHFHMNQCSIGYAGRIWNRMTNRAIFIKLHDKPIPFTKVDFLETFHLALHPSHHFLQLYDAWNEFYKKTHLSVPDSVWTDDILIGCWNLLQHIPHYVIKGHRVKFNDQNSPKLSNANLKGRNDRMCAKLLSPIQNLQKRNQMKRLG